MNASNRTVLKRGLRPWWLFPALILGLALGCGGSRSAPVSGKVTYKNQPLTMGRVAFFGPNNRIESAQIGPDGTYKIERAPVGKVKVAVEVVVPPTPPEAAKGGRMMDPAKFKKEGVEKPDASKAAPPKPVLIPDQYKDAEKSGLEFEVKSGSNTFDIDLK